MNLCIEKVVNYAILFRHIRKISEVFKRSTGLEAVFFLFRLITLSE